MATFRKCDKCGNEMDGNDIDESKSYALGDHLVTVTAGLHYHKKDCCRRCAIGIILGKELTGNQWEELIKD